MSGVGTTTRGGRLLSWRAQVVLAATALVMAFLVGTRFPHTDVRWAHCDTTEDRVRCYPEDRNGVPVLLNRHGPWQERPQTWRYGFPECLADGQQKTGPVRLGLVSGSDDGLAWDQVAWVACP